GTRTVAGYAEPQLATFVWAGQGLIGVVLLWAPLDLAERIRTGDVISDLLRPIDPVWQQLAADIGRAGYAACTRFVIPVLTGALVFQLYAPRRVSTYALFACSALLATIVCFGCRYLVNAAAYWLLDARAEHPLDSGVWTAGRHLRPRVVLPRRDGGGPHRRNAVSVGHPDSSGRARRARLARAAACVAGRAGRLGRGNPFPLPLGAGAWRAQAGDPGWLTRRGRPTAI